MKCPSVLHKFQVQVYTCGKHWVSSLCVCITLDTQDEKLPWEVEVHKKTLELDIFRKNCCNVGSGHCTIVSSLICSSWGKDLCDNHHWLGFR